MECIDKVHSYGGKVRSFVSFAGGLPAPEASDNALRYKFSWSPRGVLMAIMNPARYLMDGRVVELGGGGEVRRGRGGDAEGIHSFKSKLATYWPIPALFTNGSWFILFAQYLTPNHSSIKKLVDSNVPAPVYVLRYAFSRSRNFLGVYKNLL